MTSPHYYRSNTGFEAKEIIFMWRLSFSLGNTLKYICRAGLKTEGQDDDLRKAIDYVREEISHVERISSGQIIFPTEPYSIVWGSDQDAFTDCDPYEIARAWNFTDDLRYALQYILEASCCRRCGDYEGSLKALRALEKILVLRREKP
jgi:hypothetical protein